MIRVLEILGGLFFAFLSEWCALTAYYESQKAELGKKK